MKSLYLKIDQDDLASFFQIYDTLSPLRKKIWQRAVWWTKRFSVAQPSQSKMASSVGCSRSAVNEAFQIFSRHGWLSLCSRGFKRSKILLIPTHLQQIDLLNRQWFKRVEATYRATHSYSSYIKHTSEEKGLVREIEIPFHLKKLGIPLEDKLKLSMVPEHVYIETLHQCKKMSKTGWKPANQVKYFVGTAIRMAQNLGIKMNWPSFYASKQKRCPERV